MLANDTCEVRFKGYGLDCFDVTWMFDWYWNFLWKLVWPFMEKFFYYWGLSIEEWKEIILNFNYVDAFASNEYNPFYFWVKFWINLGDPFFKSGYALEAYGVVPDEDIFSEIFGMELYIIYYNHLVTATKAIIAEIFWRYENGVMAAFPDWIRNHCIWTWICETFGFCWDFTLPDYKTIFFWIYGYEAECFDVIMKMYLKFVMVWLILFSWLGYIAHLIVRFITLIIWWILYLIFEIMAWIILNIFIPIIELLWPIIEFFMLIWYYIMLVFWMIWYWIWFIHTLIIDLLW